jgi:hypothetical protein
MKAKRIVDKLLETDPDVPSKDYTLKLAHRVPRHQFVSDLRAAGIHDPFIWDNQNRFRNDESSVSFSGLFFGYGAEGAQRAIDVVLKKHGLSVNYWNCEPHETDSGGVTLPYHDGQRWWKFTADVTRIHFT